MVKKTLTDHAEDIRRERQERFSREVSEEAAARMRAAEETERKAAVAAEVGLPPDAPPAEVTRLHKLRESQFWDEFIGGIPHVGDRKFRQLASEVGVDLAQPLWDARSAVCQAMRKAGRPETKRTIIHPAA